MATETKQPHKKMTPTQARAARRSRRQSRRRFVRYGAAALIAVIAVIFIAALFLPGLPFGQGGRTTGGKPDGPGQRVAEVNRNHIGLGQAHESYNSVPATSGPHYAQPDAPARWGIHTEPLKDEVLVHNLEHGGIGVHYNCPDGCDEVVKQLSEIVNRSQTEGLKVIMAPYPGMDTKIALTAWTFIDKFNEFDGERVRKFITTHESSGNSPEPFAR